MQAFVPAGGLIYCVGEGRVTWLARAAAGRIRRARGGGPWLPNLQLPMSRRHKLIVGAAVLALCSLVSVREYRRLHGFGDGPQDAPSSSLSRAPCIDFHQADAHAGENVCISGMVLRAYTSKAGNTFLDFCADYRTCPFSTVIFARDRSRFGNLSVLTGQHVQIRGQITRFRGRAEIIIRAPEQLLVTP